MINKTEGRLRRATRGRKKMRELETVRLSVHRTPRHTYAQIISADGSQTLVSASTVEKIVSKELKGTGNADAAKTIGTLIAERALKAGIKVVAFDRSGFQYHGRVKALAEAAREAGLEL